MRNALLSLVIVCGVAVVFDHWILARLERQGLVASEGWKRHNRIVIANHQQKDRQIAFPRESRDAPCGVRAWLGHPVTVERVQSHRILVMGDSFVWDSPYLTLNHMWWRQLAIELKRRGYHDVEVIAAGCSGMSTHDELDLARKVVPQFRPDLIVWGFVTNDPDEGLVKQIHSSQLAPPIPGRVQSVLQKITPRLLELFKSRRAEKLASNYVGARYGYEYSDWLKRIHEGENFERYRQTVSSVGQFMKEIGTPGLLVTLPEAPISSRFDFSYEKVLPLWRDAGIPVLDNLPAFTERFPNVEPTGPEAVAWGINPADGHPGPRTTAFLAHQTADRLERDFPQVLGEKTSVQEPLLINDWLPADLNVTPVETGGWEFEYPLTDESLPSMPLQIPTILFGLAQPQTLQKIELSGEGLTSARAWISTCDPDDHYDREDWHDLGLLKGSPLSWSIPSDLASSEVSVILLHADVQPGHRRLELKLTPEVSASLRPGEER